MGIFARFLHFQTSLRLCFCSPLKENKHLIHDYEVPVKNEQVTEINICTSICTCSLQMECVKSHYMCQLS